MSDRNCTADANGTDDGNGPAEVLAADDWPQRAAAHRRRADALVAPTRPGATHPVWDFLYTYYRVRPGRLRCWHPGYGVVLAGDRARRCYLGRTGYTAHPDGVTVAADHLANRIGTVRFVAELLAATATRPAQLNCFGLHEWAMVYRSTEVRHGAVPLRLGAAGTDAVVESIPLRCTHFDAFRFFTAAAAPLNSVQLTRESQTGSEQPGCLHANMDLFKWALKLGPLVPSELVSDCFELAGAARELDMRASPYDLTGYGFSPVRVEEPAGRAEYARAQSELAHRAAALRRELLARCHILVRADRGGNRRGTPVCQPAADPQPPAPDGVICRA